MYAYAVDGFDFAQREAFDETLNAPSAAKQVDSPAKARQQRIAAEGLMAAMSRGGRS